MSLNTYIHKIEKGIKSSLIVQMWTKLCHRTSREKPHVSEWIEYLNDGDNGDLRNLLEKES